MKIQISFDLLDLNESLEIAKKVEKYCDILEIGTVLIHKYGIKAVHEFIKTFPGKCIMADTKIVDRGLEISSLYLKTGVSWISVMAGTNNEVIHRVCTETQKNGIMVMLDTIDSVMPGQMAMEAKKLGVDAIMFHKAHDHILEDTQPLEFLDEFDMIKGNTDLPIFISAGINRKNIDKILKANPYGVIIGTAITHSKDPEAEAKFFYDFCK